MHLQPYHIIVRGHFCVFYFKLTYNLPLPGEEINGQDLGSNYNPSELSCCILVTMFVCSSLPDNSRLQQCTRAQIPPAERDLFQPGRGEQTQHQAERSRSKTFMH